MEVGVEHPNLGGSYPGATKQEIGLLEAISSRATS